MRELLVETPMLRAVGWRRKPGSGSMPGTRYRPRERAGGHRTTRIVRQESPASHTGSSTYEPAGRVIAGRGAVGGTVALASGLDPDDGVNERRAGGGRRAGSVASTLDVAPVTPLLAEVLLAGTTLVDDEGRWEALSLQRRCESLERSTASEAVIKSV